MGTPGDIQTATLGNDYSGTQHQQRISILDAAGAKQTSSSIRDPSRIHTTWLEQYWRLPMQNQKTNI